MSKASRAKRTGAGDPSSHPNRDESGAATSAALAPTPAGPGALNLVKLCVGADGPADLRAWHQARAAASGPGWTPRHTTRMQPKRAAELLEGGSLYWVFRGVVLARQHLLAIEPNRGADGVSRHDLVLAPTLIATRPQPRRPFQGWRYLPGADAPADAATRAEAADGAPLPPELEEALDAFGVL
ncbi:MAG: DUF1489 domain-containing protein [Pseudomonadota bacterium]